MTDGDPIKIGQINNGTADTKLISSAANAFCGESVSAGGTGVYGLATPTSGTTYGVRGESDSTDGKGVYGFAGAISGTTYGLFGRSDSTSGTGVSGWTHAASGATNGVYGTSDSTSGTGVYGSASAASGTTNGVYGDSISTSGRGVYGSARAASGETYGVYGRSSSAGGAGVYAFNEASAGQALKCHGHALPDADNLYNCGDDTKRWKLVRAYTVRAVTVSPGDFVFENSLTVTEDEKVGLAFKNDAGEKIAVLDRRGNFHIKGKFIEGLPS